MVEDVESEDGRRQEKKTRKTKKKRRKRTITRRRRIPQPYIRTYEISQPTTQPKRDTQTHTHTQPKYHECKAMKILGLSRKPLKNQNSRNVYLQSAPLPPKFAIFRNPVFTLFIPFGLLAFLFLFLMNYYSESLTGFHGYLYNIWSCFFLPLIFLIITPKLQRFICKKLSCKL